MILTICMCTLGVAALVVLIRMNAGPKMLDRAVGLDVFNACICGIMMLWSARTGRTDVLIIVVLLALTSFMSSTVLARFARKQPREKRRKLTVDEHKRLERFREQEEARFMHQEMRLFQRIVRRG